LFTFLTLWLTFHSVVHFSTACSKIASIVLCLVCFSQVVQKQTLGEVETKTLI